MPTALEVTEVTEGEAQSAYFKNFKKLIIVRNRLYYARRTRFRFNTTLQIYLTTIRKILLDIINQDNFIVFKLSFKNVIT